MVPQAYLEEHGSAHFVSNPVGTGPYRFVRWVRDQEVVLEAFDDDWYGAPSSQEIVFRPIRESSSRVAELVTGGVDIITTLSPEAVPHVTGSGEAVDTEQIIRTILGGDGVANGCPLDPYMYGYVDGFAITMGSPDGRYRNDRQKAEVVVGQLAAFGARAELRVQEGSSYVGQVLADGREVPFSCGWWGATFPGVAISLVVLGINLYGDTLAEVLDPRSR